MASSANLGAVGVGKSESGHCPKRKHFHLKGWFDSNGKNAQIDTVTWQQKYHHFQ